MEIEDKLVKDYLEKKKIYLERWEEDLDNLWKKVREGSNLEGEIEEDSMIISDLLSSFEDVMGYLFDDFDINLPHAKVEVLLRKYKK